MSSPWVALGASAWPEEDPPVTGFLEGAKPPHLLHTHLHQCLGRTSAKAHYSPQARRQNSCKPHP